MKIRETFENRKKNGQKALVTYIVSGDYGYETTKENIRAMVKAGADVIEIGIPSQIRSLRVLSFRKPASIHLQVVQH